MTLPAVGIFGRSADPQVAAVADALARRDVRVDIVDTSTGALLRWRLDGDRVESPDGPIDWSGLYVRSHAVFTPRHRTEVVAPSARAAWLAAAERSRLAHAASKAMHAAMSEAGVRVVNPLESYTLHRSKPACDLRVRAAGLRTPGFVVTDDPAEVDALAEAVGELVAKPIAGGGTCIELPATRDAAWTAELRRALRLAPCLFQERVRGDDLRLYVVNGEVVAALRIHTDAVDYRGNEHSIERIEVGDELGAAAIAATAACGLVFSGIDIKRTADGELVVLDVNPSPMFAAVAARLDLPIAAALADCLLDGTPTSAAPLTRRAARTSGGLAVLCEGEDADRSAIARAARRHGMTARVVDLDLERIEIAGHGDAVVVSAGGASIEDPRFVLNRLGASGLGLAPATALARQPTERWRLAHLAAREEQGVILTALEQWERDGAVVVDPVRVVDRSLLRPLLRARLAAEGLSAGAPRRSEPARRAWSLLVDGEVIIAASTGIAALNGIAASRWRTVGVSEETAASLRRMAAIIGLRLLAVAWERRADTPLHVTSWTARPRCAAWDRALGVDLWPSVLDRLFGASAGPPTSFVTPDLLSGFEHPPRTIPSASPGQPPGRQPS